jgi:hypothetical protein
MNLPLAAFAVLLALLLALAWRSPKYLYAAWPVALLVIPSGRTMFGAAPFYWYDAVSLAILARLYLGGELKEWPASIPRWHRWFIGIALFFGTLVPIVRYGFSPQMLWILGHASVAWMAFPIGLALYIAPGAQTYRRFLGFGLLFALAVTAVIAVLEFGNEGRAAALNTFFFRDMQGQVAMIEDVGAALSAARVNGPHGDPNTFGGTTAIVCAICLLMFGQQRKWLTWAAVGLAVVVIAGTVSRQVLVAAAVGGLAVIAFGTARARIRVVLAATLLGLVAAASGVAAHWGHRLSKWEGGVQQDINVVGRLIIGPMRTLALINEDPSVLVVGAGLDLQKLVKKAGDQAEQIGMYGRGAASNSFLLPLYYMGIGGFVVTLWLWIWTLRKALSMPPSIRALDVASVVTTMVLIASDNYASVVKVTVAMLFLLAAIVAGRWLTQDAPSPSAATEPARSRFSNLLA